MCLIAKLANIIAGTIKMLQVCIPTLAGKVNVIEAKVARDKIL